MKGEAVSVFLRAVYPLGLKPPQLFRTLNDYEILQKKEVTYSVDRQGEKFGAAFKLARQVMNALRQIDQIGYVRYASVYRNFSEASDFQKFLGQELEEKE